MNYYNEFDVKAAAWLRELIAAGLIPAGEVDERSICDVKPEDLRGFIQCHFFAGIGGWSRALQLAGWPSDRPVWTGSCPCQSFSSAGKGKGTSDHRDLWPVFAALIRECRPPVVFGEQVEAAIRYGWLDRLRTDLEAEGYAVGGHVLGAHSAGADHIRQRLYWVAQPIESRAGSVTRKVGDENRGAIQGTGAGLRQDHGKIGTSWAGAGSPVDRLAHTASDRATGHSGKEEGSREPCGIESSSCGSVDRLADAEDSNRRSGISGEETGVGANGERRRRLAGDSATDGVGDVRGEGLQGHWKHGELDDPQGWKGAQRLVAKTSFWSDAITILCRDGKTRHVPAEPIFQFESDGIWCMLGNCWNTSNLEKETFNIITNYAKKTNAGPREILLALWSKTIAQTLQQNAGGHDEIFTTEVLLFALCQLAWHKRSELHISASDISAFREILLRIVWSNGAFARSPYKQELERSQAGESQNSMHPLSSREGSQTSEGEMCNMRNGFQATQNVPDSLPEMEEIWRSFVNEGKDKAGIRLAASFKNVLAATSCFPLSTAISGRTQILKGAGNAIVPQVAAEFIKAYMTINPLKTD